MAKVSSKKPKKKRRKALMRVRRAPRCSLCGAKGGLTRTDCCGSWICDDEADYELFSYARNSCSRNHRRLTLCGLHHAEGHDGPWQTCGECRQQLDTEMYVYYGTNEYNVSKLADPPRFDPTRCNTCGAVIRRGWEGYTQKGDIFVCEACSDPLPGLPGA